MEREGARGVRVRERLGGLRVPGEQRTEGVRGSRGRRTYGRLESPVLLTGAARFSCPPHFTELSPDSAAPRFSLEALTGPDTELWLIRAPAGFAPQW